MGKNIGKVLHHNRILSFRLYYYIIIAMVLGICQLFLSARPLDLETLLVRPALGPGPCVESPAELVLRAARPCSLPCGPCRSLGFLSFFAGFRFFFFGVSLRDSIINYARLYRYLDT